LGTVVLKTLFFPVILAWPLQPVGVLDE
jgi:hypothetical protein